MDKSPISIPKFRSETQEARWWDRHPDVAADIMERALKSGTARRRSPLKTVTMRLPVADIQAATAFAERKGLRISDLHQDTSTRSPRARTTIGILWLDFTAGIP